MLPERDGAPAEESSRGAASYHNRSEIKMECCEGCLRPFCRVCGVHHCGVLDQLCPCGNPDHNCECDCGVFGGKEEVT